MTKLAVVPSTHPVITSLSRDLTEGYKEVSTMYYVYILTNQTDNVMYIGVTNDLERRLYEHKHHLIEGFTRDYRVDKLVYFEETSDVMAAIEREKQLKKWRRAKKNALVQQTNPLWRDLSLDWQ